MQNDLEFLFTTKVCKIINSEVKQYIAKPSDNLLISIYLKNLEENADPMYYISLYPINLFLQKNKKINKSFFYNIKFSVIFSGEDGTMCPDQEDIDNIFDIKNGKNDFVNYIINRSNKISLLPSFKN